MIDTIFHALEESWHAALRQNEAHSQVTIEIIDREETLSLTCSEAASKLPALSDAYAKREVAVALESFRLGFRAAFKLTRELHDD